ncbi:acyltransferase family protein [Terrabacter sp. RAF57]|uniref:acyltransferase family protein n=1 Tax=Terrabacter sp. RAF57 TaxID=3233063 RepID=UPI003F9EA989
MGTESSAHLRSLTSLRFIAAALVVLFHLASYIPNFPLLGRLMGAGYVGVTFFFVLSGFVLTYSSDVKANATRFYRRRLARIYPVHLLFIVVAMLPFSAPPKWSALPTNVLLLQAWSPDDAVVRSFSGVSWSLSCELFFYAVFPLIVGSLWRVRRPFLTSAAVVASAGAIGVAVQLHSAEWGQLLFHLPAFRVVEFACGALAATAVMRGAAPRVRMRWAVASLVLSYLVVLFVPVFTGYRLEDRWALTLAMAPSFVALIVTCAHIDIAAAPSPLRSHLMVSLGQWSFCVYMAHPLVLAITAPLLASPSAIGVALGSFLVMSAVLGVSYLLYSTFERPLERLMRGAGPARLSDECEPEAAGIGVHSGLPVTKALVSD